MIGVAWMVAVALGGPVEDGAKAFDAGQLDEAIAAWEEPVLEGGRASGVLAYNLGTAWLRKGEPARAIAHFRAAARLRPRDGEIQHNLALARSELGAVPPAVLLPAAWMSVLTPGELGLLAVLITAMGSLFIGLQHTGRPGPGRVVGGVVLVVGLGLGAEASRGSARLAHHPVAVVVDDEAVARDAASVNAEERFRLPLGTEVRVERTYRGFILVEDGRSRRGWVAQGATQLGW